jgi:hypothetical protein
MMLGTRAGKKTMMDFDCLHWRVAQLRCNHCSISTFLLHDDCPANSPMRLLLHSIISYRL